MRRNERIEMLANLIENVEVRKQEDIVKLLADRGYKITQATISRDIKDMGLVKVINDDKSYRYVRPDRVRGDLSDLLVSSVKNVVRQGSMIRIDVVPGTSMGVKNMLRMRHPKQIFAIVTDDDTVLIYAHSLDDAKELHQLLKK